MGFRDKFNKQRGHMETVHKEAIDSSEDKGFIFHSVIRKEKIPSGIKTWVCKEGEHKIDILPFFVGDNHPKVPSGKYANNVDIWVHQNVGAASKQYVCPKRNYGLSCPICEYINVNYNTMEKTDYQKMKAKRRCFYLIWVHDSKQEEDKGIQIFECSHYFMQQHLDRKSKKKGGGYLLYSDPDTGMSFTWERVGSGLSNTRYEDHEFVERDIQPIPDEIMDATFPLDDVIALTSTYDEIKADFLGKQAEKKVEKKVEDRQESRVVEDDIDDSKFDSPCPEGGKYGEDIDTLNGCEECGIWEECNEENRQIRIRKRQSR